MQIHYKFLLLLVFAILATLAGCSIYQSDGRDCVKNGCESFVPRTVALLENAQRYCQEQSEQFQTKASELYEADEKPSPNLRVYLDLKASRTSIIIADSIESKSLIQNYCQFELKNQFELESKYKELIDLAITYLDVLKKQDHLLN
mgnify:CR=1 FL=1